MITAVDAEGLGTVHDVLVEVFKKEILEMAALSPISHVLCAHDLRSGQEQARLEKENRHRSSGRGEGKTNGGLFLNLNESFKASPLSAAIEQKSERISTPKPDRKEEDEVVQLLRGYPHYPS